MPALRRRVSVSTKPPMAFKRHLAVDSLGFPFFTHCTPANVSDDDGLIEMLSQHMAYFRIKPEHLPKDHYLAGPWLPPRQGATSSRAGVSPGDEQDSVSAIPKPSKAEKAAAGKTGFVPVKARWVVERSNAWMERCKSLVKNFERTLANANALLNLCFIRLMLKRLAATA
jgi:hypothetical protein